MLSSKTFTTSVIAILILGAGALWFASKLLWWPGILMLMTAVLLFVVMSNLDVRSSDAERRKRWTIIQRQGKRRYIAHEMMGGLVKSSPLFVYYLLVVFRNDEGIKSNVPILVIGLMLAGLIVMPIGMWHLNERRYGKSPSGEGRNTKRLVPPSLLS